MLRPLPMKLVRLLVMTDDLPQASLTLAETESFHPDPREPEEQMLSGLPGRDYREFYQQARSRLEKIAKLVPVTEAPDIDQIRVVYHEELAATNALLRERWEQASRFEEGFRHLDEEERFVRDQEAALANFADLKIDLGTLRNKTRFLDFYVGIVPRENVGRLEGAVKLADHLLFNYLQRGDSAHVVIVGPRGEKESQLQSVLSSASFQSLPIPQGLDDANPAQKHDEFARRREELQRERERLHCGAGGVGTREPRAAARRPPHPAPGRALRHAGPVYPQRRPTGGVCQAGFPRDRLPIWNSACASR